METGNGDKKYRIFLFIITLFFSLWVSGKIREASESPAKPIAHRNNLIAHRKLLLQIFTGVALVIFANWIAAQEPGAEIWLFVFLNTFIISFLMEVSFIHKSARAFAKSSNRKKLLSGTLTPEMKKKENEIGNGEMLIYTFAFATTSIIFVEIFKIVQA